MAVQNEQRRKLSWVESLIEARSGLEMRYNNVADYIPHNGCTAGLSSCLCNSQVKVIQSTSAVIVIATTHTHTHTSEQLLRLQPTSLIRHVREKTLHVL